MGGQGGEVGRRPSVEACHLLSAVPPAPSLLPVSKTIYEPSAEQLLACPSPLAPSIAGPPSCSSPASELDSRLTDRG